MTASLSDLNVYAAGFQQVSESLEKARIARQQEVEGDRSLWAKMVDAVSQTPAEELLSKIESEHSSMRSQAISAANAWVSEDVYRQTSGKIDLASLRVERALKVFVHTSDRAKTFKSLARLGRATLSSLSDAIEQCDSAHTMEVMDLVSTNKGIALMSTLSTSDASDAISRANRNIKSFGEALKSSQLSEANQTNSDLTDLAFDLAFDLPLDIFSWMNMEKLAASEASCRAAYRKVEPIYKRVSEIANTAEQRADRARADLEASRAPFVEIALKKLPPVLVDLVNEDSLERKTRLKAG